MRNIRTRLTPNAVLGLLLLCWWALNVLQSSFTQLADDEAYYWYYASSLDWGYFDHPPVTALLVAMGSFIGGPLGIRFFFTLLQPLALYLFWTLIRPETPSLKDALLYFVICFSLPVAQLYGFIASPDAPLMFSTVVFLWAYRRFSEEDSLLNTLLLGGAMALMAYSKYHGALVVLFTVMSNPGLLIRPRLYLSGVVTLLLFAPHLMWQYQHDWVSFRYHLVGRNGSFHLSDLTEFLLNVLLIFNPLFIWFYVRGWGRGSYAARPVQKALYFCVAGFLLFFTFSSLRGYVQPQWVLPATYGLIMILFGWSRQRDRAEKYLFRAGAVMAVLFLLVRVEAAFNPLGLKFETFDNEASYGAIAEAAGGRPVIFCAGYSQAAKYVWYTGCQAYCQNDVNYRPSQWQFDTVDRSFTGRDVVVELPWEKLDSICGHLALKNGNDFLYMTMPDFHPVREVAIDMDSPLPETVYPSDVIRRTLTLHNPYQYPVTIDGGNVKLEMVWGRHHEPFSEYDVCPGSLVIPPFGESMVDICFTVPPQMQVSPRYGDPDAPIEYRTGFALKYGHLPVWIQSEESHVTLCH